MQSNSIYCTTRRTRINEEDKNRRIRIKASRKRGRSLNDCFFFKFTFFVVLTTTGSSSFTADSMLNRDSPIFLGLTSNTSMVNASLPMNQSIDEYDSEQSYLSFAANWSSSFDPIPSSIHSPKENMTFKSHQLFPYGPSPHTGTASLSTAVSLEERSPASANRSVAAEDNDSNSTSSSPSFSLTYPFGATSSPSPSPSPYPYPAIIDKHTPPIPTESLNASALYHDISSNNSQVSASSDIPNIFATITSPEENETQQALEIMVFDTILSNTQTKIKADTSNWKSFLFNSLFNVTIAVLPAVETDEPTPVPFDWNKAILHALYNVTLTVGTGNKPTAVTPTTTVSPTVSKQLYAQPFLITNYTTSIPPTLLISYKLTKYTVRSITMKLISSPLLSDLSITNHEEVTSDHIKRVIGSEILLQSDDESMHGLYTDVILVDCVVKNQTQSKPANVRHLLQRFYYSNGEDTTIIDYARRDSSSSDNNSPNFPLWIKFDCDVSLENSRIHQKNATSINNTQEQYQKSIEQIIAVAFTSPDYQTTYKNALSSKDNVFINVIDLDVYMNGIIIAPREELNTGGGAFFKKDQNGYTSPGEVVGYTLAAVFFILVLGCFIYCSFKRRRHSCCASCANGNVCQFRFHQKCTQKTESTDTSKSNRLPQNRIIQVDDNRMDDISTLGDLGFLTEFRSNQQRETATEGGYSVDYDYTGAFRGEALTFVSSVAATGTRTAAGRSEMITTSDFPEFDGTHTQTSSATNSYTTKSKNTPQDSNNNATNPSIIPEQEQDDETMIIEVDAPSGKLGLILDTPNGSMPMVQAMKESSVLSDQVKIGDLLVSVDGFDTRRMSAIRVSQLISMYSINPARKLVFVRNNNWL